MLDSSDFEKSLQNISIRYPLNQKGSTISLTCHFKQLGLNEGLPVAASSSAIKTYRLGSWVGVGVRRGSSFGGYMRTGTLSNSLFNGAGIVNRSLTLFACLLKEPALEGLDRLSAAAFSSFSSSGGIGKERRLSSPNHLRSQKVNQTKTS